MLKNRVIVSLNTYKKLPEKFLMEPHLLMKPCQTVMAKHCIRLNHFDRYELILILKKIKRNNIKCTKINIFTIKTQEKCTHSYH